MAVFLSSETALYVEKVVGGHADRWSGHFEPEVRQEPDINNYSTGETLLHSTLLYSTVLYYAQLGRAWP